MIIIGSTKNNTITPMVQIIERLPPIRSNIRDNFRGNPDWFASIGCEQIGYNKVQ